MAPVQDPPVPAVDSAGWAEAVGDVFHPLALLRLYSEIGANYKCLDSPRLDDVQRSSAYKQDVALRSLYATQRYGPSPRCGVARVRGTSP